jgi:hypothetical protein
MGCADEVAMLRLQQGFVTSEMGFNSEVARQQSKAAHVRFADMTLGPGHVRFTPESGH